MTGQWRLSAVECDVLWRELGYGAPPYPIELASPGTTHQERAEIVATVHAGLATRGLVDERGAPVPALAGTLTLLATSEVLIDGQLILDEHIRLAAARRGDTAAIVSWAVRRQEWLTVRSVAGPRLAVALAEPLPPVPRAHGQSVSLPYQALAGALRGLGEGNGRWEFEQALQQAGVRGPDVRWIAELITASRAAGAQFGVTVRPGTSCEHRVGVLSWYAAPYGSVMINRREGGDWVTIVPADATRLVARLDELTTLREGTI